jgi:hypothetical protein
MQAVRSTRSGGCMSYVGVPTWCRKDPELFWTHGHLHTGPAPVRRFLPELVDLLEREDRPRQRVRSDTANRPGCGGYRAMDERRAIKTLLHP